MVDITETCKPQSGWKSKKFFEFVKLHSAEARDLIGVGFLSGLTEDEAAHRRRKWKSTSDASSAWYAGLSAAKKKARAKGIKAWNLKKKTRSEYAEIKRKAAATQKKNGTKMGPKIGGKVSERARRC
jgi:hypothetical protein